MLKLQQAVRHGEVNGTCHSFLSFVKLQCVSVRGNGQRPEGERNFGEIVVVESDRRVERDY